MNLGIGAGTRSGSDDPSMNLGSWLGPMLDIGGVAANAVAGALVAGRQRFDWLGVAIVAGVTAIGGGTVRDLLLDRPVFWVQNPQHLQAILLATVFTLIYTRWRPISQRLLEIPDTLGLALFGIAGARIALGLGHHALIAVVMGVITGSFGGLLRDVLCNEVPMLLKKGQLYGTAVIAGCSLYVGLLHFGVAGTWAAAAGMVTIVLVRAAAIAYNLRLPVFQLPP